METEKNELGMKIKDASASIEAEMKAIDEKLAKATKEEKQLWKLRKQNWGLLFKNSMTTWQNGWRHERWLEMISEMQLLKIRRSCLMTSKATNNFSLKDNKKATELDIWFFCCNIKSMFKIYPLVRKCFISWLQIVKFSSNCPHSE